MHVARETRDGDETAPRDWTLTETRPRRDGGTSAPRQDLGPSCHEVTSTRTRGDRPARHPVRGGGVNHRPKEGREVRRGDRDRATAMFFESGFEYPLTSPATCSSRRWTVPA